MRQAQQRNQRRTNQWQTAFQFPHLKGNHEQFGIRLIFLIEKDERSHPHTNAHSEYKLIPPKLNTL
jgi:hypothetical protein